MSQLSAAPPAKPRGTRKRRRTGRSTEDVLAVIRERIASHELLPGSRVQEAELAKEFGVSRTIVREVLTALEYRGLIKRIPNRGAVVTHLELSEVYEIFEIREVLEGLCVRLATLKAPKGAWRKHIDRLGPSMQAMIEGGDVGDYIRALDDLRDDMVHYAGNSHAAQFLDQVLEKARVIKGRVTVLPGRAETGRRMHLEMLKLMDAGDANAAELKKQEIIRSAREWLDRYRNYIL
ncbi:MAG: GntR family transcriptional regulator [Hyphomicrobiales bacterium]